jgi:hypothetical protein
MFFSPFYFSLCVISLILLLAFPTSKLATDVVNLTYNLGCYSLTMWVLLFDGVGDDIPQFIRHVIFLVFGMLKAPFIMPTKISLVGINRSSYLYFVQDIKTYLMKAFYNNYLCPLHIVIKVDALPSSLIDSNVSLK